MPSVSVDLDGDGLFIIIGIDNTIEFFGAKVELSEHFNNVEYLGSTLEIEAANLLGDFDRLSIGVRNLNWAADTANSFSKWKSLERQSFEDVQNVRRKQALPDHQRYPELEADYASLTSNPENSDWSVIWLRLWARGYRRDSLVKTACWRVDSGYAPLRDSARVYRTIIDHNRDTDYVGKYCLRWLSEAHYSWPDWIGLCASMWSRRVSRDAIMSVMIEQLSPEYFDVRFMQSAWRRAWQFAWTRLQNSDPLLSFAEAYFQFSDTIAVSDGEMLMYLFRDVENISRLHHVAVKWLSTYPRNTLIWADIYLASIEYEASNELIDVGHYWLREYGGTTNRWLRVWQSLESTLDKQNQIDLALMWLPRARWDLRSWPEVFSIAALRNHDSGVAKALSSIGARWLASYGRWSRSREDVRKLVRHLNDQLGVGSPV